MAAAAAASAAAADAGAAAEMEASPAAAAPPLLLLIPLLLLSGAAWAVICTEKTRRWSMSSQQGRWQNLPPVPPPLPQPLPQKRIAACHMLTRTLLRFVWAGTRRAEPPASRRGVAPTTGSVASSACCMENIFAAADCRYERPAGRRCRHQAG